MRRLLSLLLAFLCAVSAFACTNGGQAPIATTQSASITATLQSTPATTPITTPAPTPTVTPGDTASGFAWNPYLLYDDLSSDEDLYASACILIDALLEYKEYAQIESNEHRLAIIDNIFFNFPPSALADFENDEQGGRIKISYQLGREEHLKAIEAFGKKIEQIVSTNAKSEYNETQNALCLYRYVAVNVNYFKVDYTGKQISAYNALMHNTTICYGYADAFNYLLRQIGIKAYLIKGRVAYTNRDDAHGWSYISLDGKYYHCDPTWEHSYSKGNGLNYFGLTDARRFTSSAVSYEKKAYISEGSLKTEFVRGDASSNIFAFCSGSKSWRFDGEYLVVN